MDKEIPLGTVFKGVVWFLPAYLIAAALMMMYPQMVLFLPQFVR
jgi:TRAP-type C4-dicarboxylate transport system permease large subunit